MSEDQPVTYDTILETVYQWPSAKRLTLIQDILQTLVPSPVKRGGRTLDRALGLLATGGPAPSDEDIQRWLDEHRIEKYG